MQRGRVRDSDVHRERAVDVKRQRERCSQTVVLCRSQHREVCMQRESEIYESRTAARLVHGKENRCLSHTLSLARSLALSRSLSLSACAEMGSALRVCSRLADCVEEC